MKVALLLSASLVFTFLELFYGYSRRGLSPVSTFKKFPRIDTIHLAKQNEKTLLESRVCRRCKCQYLDRNQSCMFHPGIYSGRLNRVNDIDTSDLEYFWSCCGQASLGSTGCVLQLNHLSYDKITIRHSVH